MPGIEDWVHKPHNIIQQIIGSPSPCNYHEKVSEYFEKKLSSSQDLCKVPSLNDNPLHDLKSGSLVRFRCMVQDMFGPEMFFGAYEVIDVPSRKRFVRSGMYKDDVDCQKTEEVDMDSPRNKTMDRLTYYCISVPGENDWVKKGYSKMQAPSAHPTTSAPTLRQKRSFTSTDDSTCERPMDTSNEVENPACGNKRTKATENVPTRNPNSQPTANTPRNLNFPLPNMEGTACLLKLYDQDPSLKINDVIEVVGVLSADPTQTIFGCPDVDPSVFSIEKMNEMDIELQAHNPPASLVPRVHAVMVKKLEHTNPHLPRNISAPESKPLVDEMLSQAPKIRCELHAILSQALMGDELAADYLLCHLISSIYVRREGVVLGKFSLNLSNVLLHDNYNAQLYNLLQKIVTKSWYIPLSLENLNTYTFTPKKDYTEDRLVSGVLQLPSRIHVVLDETALAVGRLDTKGVRNVTALGHLITWQSVDYDFSFHRMEYVADVAALVLSEGKSFLPSDSQVPLQNVGACGSPSSVFKAIDTYLTDSLVEQIQCYLTILKLVDYGIDESLQKLVQEDFVSMRRENNSFGADDLHSLLVLARFLSLGIGERSLSRESWEKAKALESERKQRIRTST